MTEQLLDYERRHLEQVRSLAPECALFLKRSGKLPLPGPCDIALYGSGARHTVQGGTGSGEVNSRFSVTVEEGLREAGFQILTTDWLDRYDAVRKQAYAAFIKKIKSDARKHHTSALVEGMGAVMPEPEYEIPLERRCSTAVYVLSRISGEGSDRKIVPGDFLLSESEQRDILALQELYPVFLLVLNVGGPVDLSPVVRDVDDILLLSQLGAQTGTVLADILLGAAYPSGKLTTSWVRSEDLCPQAEFGQKEETHYKEGIYVGYRYYDAAHVKPLFPFGFGLGYGDFRIEPGTVALAGEQVTVSTQVRSTGAFPGKEVVQLYLSSPWGALDQPVQALAAYGKTRELAPGESCRMELSFRMSDLASFDAARSAYVLAKGDYVLRCGSSSRTAKPMALLRLTQDVVTEKVHSLSGAPDFTDWVPEGPEAIPEGLPVYVLDAASIPCRTHTYEEPLQPDPAVQALTDEELVYLNIGGFRLKDRAGVVGDSGSAIPGTAGETASCLKEKGIPALVMSDGPAGIRLARDYYEDKKGAHSLGSAMLPTMIDLLPAPARAAMTRPKKLPKGVEIKHRYATAIPIGTAIAQSFSLSLAESCGDIVGDEMERFGIHLLLVVILLLALSGLCAAADVRGVQKHPGRGVTIKHFAANNQETNRYNNNSNVSQRALREIYLRGFGLCIRESQPRAVMTSYNLINGTHTSESRELTMGILRGEFGFRGIVMTDWVVGGSLMYNSKRYPMPNAGKVALAGGDLFMPGSRADYNRCLAMLRQGMLPRYQLELNATRVVHMARKLTEEEQKTKE